MWLFSASTILFISSIFNSCERVILPKPERLGYIFGGWYIDSKFSQPANIKTMPNQNIMLYAKWYEDPITIGLRVKKNK